MTLIISVLVLSYIRRLVEQPFVRIVSEWGDDLFIDSIYMTIITITTVGFGDFVPYTRLGKLVTMVTAL